ncbi:unnamed protein product [Bursaphelenchus xylophilus]|uniref:glucuronosyltransferase n=1 Tax=Bursaphelenchus xylophilus TaxID=6326 RepID=A0A1I7SC95_BURXY|nr:unnamed protein product [Bursaphelenchus xylophilus]CAG9094517.1 unnamed protein product [Bursaphelenchus xylophilus]
MFYQTTLLLLFAALFIPSTSHKILVYSLRFGQSHVLFMRSIADALAEAGHDVTFYQHEFYDQVKYVGCEHAKVVVRKRDYPVKPFPNFWETGGQSDKEWMMYQDIGQNLATACYHQLRDTNLTNRLRQERFELAIGEHFDTCTYALFEVLGIKKYISAYAAPIFPQALELLGHGMTTAYIPALNNNDMSYVERAKAFLLRPIGYYYYNRIFEQPVKEAVRAALGRSFDVNAAFVQSSYAFVNGDEHLEYQQPTSQKVVYIGGITQHNTGKIPEPFKKVLKSARRGVILVSFGTVATGEVMPNKTKEILSETFAQFPDIKFLFKHNDRYDPLFRHMDNVVVEKWVPQKEVLAHPKTIGFITHGGLNSVSETAFHGVPSVCIPLFGDQERNCMMGEMHGILTTVRRQQLDATSLITAVRKILSDQKIRDNAAAMKEMMQNKPTSARDRVVKFTEHAIRFDIAKIHDLRARQLNTLQYYGLDVYLPIVFVVFSIFFVVYKSIRVVFSMVVKFKVE